MKNDFLRCLLMYYCWNYHRLLLIDFLFSNDYLSEQLLKMQKFRSN